MYALKIREKLTIKLIVIFICLNGFAYTTCAQLQNNSAIKLNGEVITSESVIAHLSKSLSKDKVQIARAYVLESFQGVNQNNKAMVDKGIQQFKDFVIANIARSKWEACGDHCEGENDPVSYGFCYWKCIANGGPPAPTPTPPSSIKMPPKSVKAPDKHN